MWALGSPVKRALKSAGSYPKATVLCKMSPLSHMVKTSSRYHSPEITNSLVQKLSVMVRVDQAHLLVCSTVAL